MTERRAVTLPNDLDEWVEAYRERQGWQRSHLYREALKQYMRLTDFPAPTNMSERRTVDATRTEEVAR